MKTDAIFYELIRELPQIFFELIGKPDTNPNVYEFTALEIKQKSFRLDGLFSTIAGFENEPLYFVELQTYKDEEFYERLFGEIFLYFRQYKPANYEWYAIVIYDRRINETLPHPRYQFLIEHHVRRIYLNELNSETDDSIGIGITKLFVETPRKTPAIAKKLINQAREELTDENLRLKVLAFIQTVVVYKFPDMTLEEIETMLNLGEDIEKTAFYQSILKKTKLQVVPALLKRGLSIQEIAESLEIDVEEVRKIAEEQ
ncbi:MAG: Rpn family recombination-promoting nuclease/putative transposase [Nostoc sp. DedQUE05]|uniref:Rpn family recombination-promoting nuclease/putative transposase n=1 Tax=Nostoc sp. DedQUE05 TaxID=3075391 RepID=UPI002AD254F5|nr:Rpn family recombination-promoting nuclease/putative transposase [Nostoc sp. DedQUE05]MDZ8095796.1 Rpn family recombination-promoting nuclease/putative transposase [Nostoc sp. DedQUE05]